VTDAKTDALRLLTHDLRGLLAGIRAIARELADTERLWASPEGLAYARDLERSAADALEMLDGVAERLRGDDQGH
jgi:hypothetical protein